MVTEILRKTERQLFYLVGFLKHLIVAAGIPHIKDDLNVKRLNEIHRWLKLAGLSMPPRSLNYQRARLRSIIACEQTDMHLVWAPGYIFIKPLPDYLLDAKFWTDHLTGDKDLYGLCMGLLLSYTALIQYRSDFVIAKNEGLIKDSLEWEDWVKHSAAVLAQTNPTVNKRYKYGELRMSRLNKILWAHFQLRGYRFPYQTYGEMFISNMVPIAGATIYALASAAHLQNHHPLKAPTTRTGAKGKQNSTTTEYNRFETAANISTFGHFTPAPPTPAKMPSSTPPASIIPLAPLKPDLYERAWSSTPHPTLPSSPRPTAAPSPSSPRHSHPAQQPHQRPRALCPLRRLEAQPTPGRLCLVSGSFDSTAGLWSQGRLLFPSGTFLATCSRDKSVWIWEDVGAEEDDDEWETVVVLNDHEGDVKAVAWCPDVPGRNARRSYSSDVLASASYDDTVRIWREDGDGEWVCVAVLTGHAGTVWGIAWEGRERPDGAFPRLLSCSADGTVKVWKLKVDADEDDQGGPAPVTLGGIPNTMRRSAREDWECEAVLPKVHTRDVYSVAWSPKTGLVATTGNDGVIALYREEEDGEETEAEGEQQQQQQQAPESSTGATESASGPAASKRWKLIATYDQGHGAYEINHITWCPRYDSGRKTGEEMLVTTGDDGQVRTWRVSLPEA
ncbi:unnamed protein product [Parascedosporium putredinis]|uniref:Probable cytosolic iron-sulfur protein assembly protein 1 n=1 Tax=Parascedosporium putredinis TaxID=1442378 RepID=A0A9P1GXA0_9PEZI|nr:unnamed protein product [Parascedosporium putredinis]CAI7988830.1 unnamed protein product [Parascedosporium putredinis]